MKRAALLVFALLIAGPARAYEPVTHAGLTERAALSAPLHKLLIERLGLPLGLYEPLTLHRGSATDRDLLHRVSRLDPEGGYSADDGRQTVLGWLAAGSVLEGVPATRNRNHFLDPTTGKGLHDVGRDLALRTRMADVGAGTGSVRGVFTGTNFDGSGEPAVEWLLGRDNEWGLRRYLDERERAASAAAPTDREDALVRALLAAGAILHVVEDMGAPSHVRNDFRVAIEADGARYERLVAQRFGRIALPEGGGGKPPHHGRLMDLLHDSSGGGLADRTNRRFFSDGTLPGITKYPLPAAQAGAAASGYVPGDTVAHLARWDRVPGGVVVWSLDERCLLDYAQALLPETTRYAEAALELLFHTQGGLDVTVGDSLTIGVRDLGLGAGMLSIYADTASGERRPLERKSLSSAQAGETLTSVHRPDWARHATAVFRGVDRTGEPVVLVEEVTLK
jgi:hypothetical protein